MKKILLLASVVALTSFSLNQKKQKVIFFGDSITQAGAEPGGFIRIMEDMLKQQGKDGQFDLVGAGIGGNKVYDLYLRMDDDVLSQHPDIVVIWVGVNDVWHKRSFGTGTDADKFEKFYHAIIKKLKDQNIKVLLCTPAAIGERTDFSNELDGDLNYYANIVRDIAGKDDCGLIDLRKDFLAYDLRHNKENKESGILTRDRVHLNETGNKFVAQKMLQALAGGQ